MLEHLYFKSRDRKNAACCKMFLPFVTPLPTKVEKVELG